MLVVRNPVEELKSGRIDLALDLTAEQAASLEKPTYVVPLPSDPIPNRAPNLRIYFLAINNNRKPLLADKDVRVALGRAVRREKLLDDHFRGPLKTQIHHVINGPYPAGCWACDPDPTTRGQKNSLELYDPDLARTFWKRALGRWGVKDVSLKLKYPGGDKALANAMKELCAQLGRDLPGLRVEPVELSAYDLRKDVEETQDYDLAYYHHDFADETFWLLPLLGPQGRQGKENYLGYSGPLLDKIYSGMNLRDFPKVREYAQAIHRDFVTSEMPFIPLWQLDPLFAYRAGDLELPPVDAQLLFTDIELWRVTR
jgi:ABC-type oligopeptide transport system substrate-binding subunit